MKCALVINSSFDVRYSLRVHFSRYFILGEGFGVTEHLPRASMGQQLLTYCTARNCQEAKTLIDMVKHIDLLLIEQNPNDIDLHPFLNELISGHPHCQIILLPTKEMRVPEPVLSEQIIATFHEPIDYECLSRFCAVSLQHPQFSTKTTMVEAYLTGLSIFDVIQLKNQTNASVILICETYGRMGEITFISGNIVHAEVKSFLGSENDNSALLLGLEALEQIVSWESIYIREKRGDPYSQCSIDTCFSSVLLHLVQFSDTQFATQ